MSWSKLYEGAEPIRINKWLASESVCSRREAEALIAAGQVFIDAERVADPGRKILPGQTLRLAAGAGAKLEAQISIVINKPIGYVSAQPEPGQIPAARLIRKETLWGPLAPVPRRDAKLAPIGRLDMDSRGLLLLSEDGVLTKAIIGPASAIEKDYLVAVEGALNDAKIKLLRHGLELDGRQLKPAKVSVAGANVLRFVLQEGRNRQIRRMCDLVGLRVVDLQRVRIGPLSLGDLPEGRWRPLAPAERAAFFA